MATHHACDDYKNIIEGKREKKEEFLFDNPSLLGVVVQAS